MLIRSQDKKLIVILERSVIGITKDFCVCAISKSCVSPAEISGGVIGKYSTEEKAIKVLDMIEEKYKEPIYQNDIGGNEIAIYKNVVFQMPKDEEVEE